MADLAFQEQMFFAKESRIREYLLFLGNPSFWERSASHLRLGICFGDRSQDFDVTLASNCYVSIAMGTLLTAKLAVLYLGAVMFVYYVLPTASQHPLRRFVDRRPPFLSGVFR